MVADGSALPPATAEADDSACPMDVCAGGGFSLLALPTDLLITVLHQATIGAQELCCLEECASALKAAVDEEIWRAAFLNERRSNALREPDSWKSEFARRESWSRGWRQLGTSSQTPACAPTRLGGHTQKLRRFALKMISTVPAAPPPPQYATYVVDPRGSETGSFPTISSALMRAKPFDTILVEPGTYFERLRLEKPVELISRGALGSCLIVGTDGPTIEVRACTASATD